MLTEPTHTASSHPLRYITVRHDNKFLQGQHINNNNLNIKASNYVKIRLA